MPPAQSSKAFTDFSLWEKFIYDYQIGEVPYTKVTAIPVQADEELVQALEKMLLEGYAYGGLENFYVKSSATGLMQKTSPLEAFSAPQKGYFKTEADEETSADAVLRGLAYHAFLEHFDFAKLGGDLRVQVTESLKKFADEQAFETEYFAYLEVDKLCEILSLPIFARLKNCALYKEREFLVGITVEEVLALQGKDAGAVVDKGEEVLFQGAIDLLAVGEEKTYIVDYKYSSGSEKYLKEHYAPQLALYKKAVAKIQGVDESAVRCTIVNIYEGFELQV